METTIILAYKLQAVNGL